MKKAPIVLIEPKSVEDFNKNDPQTMAEDLMWMFGLFHYKSMYNILDEIIKEGHATISIGKKTQGFVKTRKSEYFNFQIM
jgi:hypothetical protein